MSRRRWAWLAGACCVWSLGVAAQTVDLARFSQAPPQTGIIYDSEPARILEHIGDRWRKGRHLDAVHYAAHAPPEHDQAIARWILARMPDLPTPYYFLLSRKSFSSSPDEAVFWHLVAGVNAFHDVARCAGQGAAEQVSHLFSINQPAAVWKEVVRQRGALNPLLGRAVRWLQANPEQAPPAYLCDAFGDAAPARRMRDSAIAKLEAMRAEDAVPVASEELRSLVFANMEVRQDVLLSRLSLENLASAEEVRNPEVLAWAGAVTDELLREYLALAYLRYWDEEVARAALAYHQSPEGQKMINNAVNQRLGLPTEPLTEAEEAQVQAQMSRPALQRMVELHPQILRHQGMLMRMAADAPPHVSP